MKGKYGVILKYLCITILIVFLIRTLPAMVRNTSPHDIVPENVGAVLENVATGIYADEMAQKCDDVLSKVLDSESYYLMLYVTSFKDSNRKVIHLRCHGENALMSSYSNGANILTELWYNGHYAKGVDTHLVEQNDNITINTEDILKYYSPNGKHVSVSDKNTEDDSIQLEVKWTEFEDGCECCYTGTLEYTFNSDNLLKKIKLKAKRVVNGSEEELIYEMTIMQEEPEQTLSAIKKMSSSICSQQEYEEHIKSNAMPNDRPSNRTNYDFSLSTHFDEKNWGFFEGQFAFTMTVENISATEITIVNTSLGNDKIDSLDTSAAYFIEVWESGMWVDVPTMQEENPEIIPDNIFSGGEIWGYRTTKTINWEKYYGILKPGFYRIGQYYTATLLSGQTEVQICYAKFRIYDEKTERLLKLCKAALEKLLQQDSYHLLSTDWNIEHIDINADREIDDSAYYYTTEVWKHKGDYLQECRYYLYKNSTIDAQEGTMLLDGMGYNLVWEKDAYSKVTSWSMNEYTQESMFQIWTNSLQYNNANVCEVSQEANSICIIENSDFYDDVPYLERVYSFNNLGNLTGISYSFLTNEKMKIVSRETVIYTSSATEIANVIDHQDVTTVNSFNWETEKQTIDWELAQTSGFVNTRPHDNVTTMLAMQLAHNECAYYNGDESYASNIKTAYYDKAAKIWKIICGYSFSENLTYTVYLSDEGITQLVVKKN